MFLSFFDLRFGHLLADVFDFVEQLAIDVVFASAGQTFDELRCSAGRTVVQRHARPAPDFLRLPSYDRLTRMIGADDGLSGRWRAEVTTTTQQWTEVICGAVRRSLLTGCRDDGR